MPTSIHRPHVWALVALLIVVFSGVVHARDSLWVSTLDLTKMRQSWGEPQRDRSVTQGKLSVDGEIFSRGVGTHASSRLWVHLGGKTLRFRASVGVDDSAGSGGTVRFRVVGDGVTLFDSGIMRARQIAKRIDVDVNGVADLVLAVNDAGDGIGYDHADWGNARFLFEGEQPAAVDPPRDEPTILTPPPGPAPRINGPSVYGCGPHKPFLYRIPCTGNRPVTFTAQGLPPSLRLDAGRGIISGTAPARGRYPVRPGRSQSSRICLKDPDHRERRGTCPDTPHGMESLVRPLRQGDRPADPRGGRPDGQQRHG